MPGTAWRCTGWTIRLAETHRSNCLEGELRKISRYGFIVIDEVGYGACSAVGASATATPADWRRARRHGLVGDQPQ